MPYAVVSLLVTYGYSNLVTPTVAIIPSFFAKSSTAYNPVIYIFMSRKVGTGGYWPWIWVAKLQGWRGRKGVVELLNFV